MFQKYGIEYENTPEEIPLSLSGKVTFLHSNQLLVSSNIPESTALINMMLNIEKLVMRISGGASCISNLQRISALLSSR